MKRLLFPMPLARCARAIVGLAIGILAILALPASPASAHAGLVRTSPLQGSVVETAPSEVLITFSEQVTPVADKIKVFAPDGKVIDTGAPRVSGDVLHIPVRTNVAKGTYLASYRVISEDAHPVAGGFIYSVGAPSATAASLATQSQQTRTDPVVSGALSVAEYLGFAGLILVAGPALILFGLWPRRLDRTGPTRMANLGLGVAALGTLAELYLEAPYSTGAGLFGASGSDLVDVLTNRYGVLHLVRLGVLAAAALLLRPHLAGKESRVVQSALVLLGVVSVATFSLAGHPGSSTAPALTVVADAAHLASVAIWLGGLLVLFGFLLRKANEGELREILPVWSNWATLAVAVLVLAGTAQALVEIGSVSALFHTGYGQLVLAKVGLLAVVLGVAYFSRRLVRRDPESSTVRRLRRSVLAEVLGAVVILGLASVLVQTAPARTAAAASPYQQVNGPFSTTVTTSLYQLQIDLSRSVSGDYEMHLYAYTPAGAPLKVVEWQASAALPAKGIEPISISLLPLTDSHATAQVRIASSGNWTFRFTLRTSDVDEATTSTTVPIK